LNTSTHVHTVGSNLGAGNMPDTSFASGLRRYTEISSPIITSLVYEVENFVIRREGNLPMPMTDCHFEGPGIVEWRYFWLGRRVQGVRTAKIAIAPDCGARLLRPFGHRFWYVFARGSRFFCAVLFKPTVSAVVSVFRPLSHRYSWYVRCLCVFCIV